MKSGINRVLNILLMVILILPFFSGCNNSKAADAGTASTNASKDNEKQLDKPEKIKVFVDTMLPKEQGQVQFAEEYRKQTGISLEITQPPHNQYYDAMNVTLASGDIPDVVEITDKNYVQYASKGAFVDMDSYYQKSEVLQNTDKTFVDALRIGGKLYGFPLQNGGGCVTFIRKDWLVNLGLKIPTTYEELLNIMKAFTFDDPDKNGKNDTVGYTAILNAEGLLQDNYLRDFYWQSSPNFIIKNGKWIDGFAQPEFMDALERLKKVYQEQIMDQKLFTNQTSTCRENIIVGKAGIISYWDNYWSSRLDDQLKQLSGNGGELVAIPSIKESYYLNRPPIATAIMSKTKNPAGVFKYFIEYMHDGGKGQELFTYGVKNVHWQEKNGKVEMMPNMSNPNLLFDKVWLSADNTVTPFTDGPLIPIDGRITSAINAFKANYRQLQTTPPSDTYLKTGKDLERLRIEIAGKIIIGDVTPEQGMQRYNQESKTLGVDRILNEFNSVK